MINSKLNIKISNIQYSIFNFMQYAVPQFIEVEDKIIGPLTLKQFIPLTIGGVIIYAAWSFCDLSLFITIAIPTVLFFTALTFLKVNERPFIFFLMGAATFFLKPRLRVWRREAKAPQIRMQKGAKEKGKARGKKKLTRQRLRELAAILDTGGGYKGSMSNNQIQMTNVKSK